MRLLKLGIEQQQAREEVWLYKGLPFEYEEVTNPITGRIWMDRNLGADRVAQSSTDADAYGDLFQWGRLDDLHQNRTSGTTTTQSIGDVPGHGDFIIGHTDWRNPSNNNLWQPPAKINVPAPPGWRVPTIVELLEEGDTWVTQDVAGAFGSVLKLPAGGLRRETDGGLAVVGARIYLWSSTISIPSGQSQYLRVITSATENTQGRGFGSSVRLIKEL